MTAVDREQAVWDRLEEQISWYDLKSSRCQKIFKSLKVLSITAAATVPLVAGFGLSSIYSACLGVLITVSESIQHLNQYHHNWITYRSTCEALRHEKHMFLAQAGPYQDASDRLSLLAERSESLISTEHSKWISGQHAASKAGSRSQHRAEA